MDHNLKSLYSQIKEGKISSKDALEQMKEFLTPDSQTNSPTLYQEDLNIHAASKFKTPASDLSGKIQKYLLAKLNKVVTNRARLANLEVNLMDLGLESSQLVTMSHEIENEANIELTPTIFFEYPSVKELTEFFAIEHHDAFAKVLGSIEQPKTSEAANNSHFQALISPKELDIPKVLSQIIQPESVPKHLHTSPSASETAQPVKDDIAIIGMHGLFAEANDLNQFWNNLLSKKDLMKEIPLDHWDYRPWYDANRGAKDKTYCKWGSFIDNVDKFDASFFNISPREAEWMDPQIRLLLQSIYATGEDAGYINKLRGSNTGVFVGVCFHDYADKIAELDLPVDPYMATGNSQTVLANRISFILNLMGPSVAIDTACSSSLFALHYACRAIRNKECGMAFVGGANLLLSSAHYRNFCSIGALSPSGRCHTFDAAADGYTPGECVASILLKPLARAERDGDRIYAVIKGSAALHGGYTPSLTAPSVAGEENVILKAWEDAAINPETISYIEAHGTGTKLGDPIEIDSLKKAFKRFTDKEHFCALGSAKANIGHAEGAAGIAGLVKVILQMKNKQIPCLPRLNKLNPYIQIDKSALYINQETQEWKSQDGAPRRAGISSFGFSGAYAHAVIEEYIAEDGSQPQYSIIPEHPVIIILSAKKQDRLREQVEQLLGAVRSRQFSDIHLDAIAYTLQVSREAMEERLGLIVCSIKELEEKLQGFLNGRDGIPDLYRGQLKNNQDNLAAFTDDDDLEKTIDAWIVKGKYAKLLDLWVKGLSFDWSKLYVNNKPRPISLPTYPFAKERYWVPESEHVPVETHGRASLREPIHSPVHSYMHPLLHQNTSNFAEQRFSSTFTGQEFFLADHVVKGQRVLPGVAYLEMARAAVESSWPAAMTAATGPLEDGKIAIRLKNVVWAKPIVVKEQPVQVNIGLSPEENGAVAYEIYGGHEEEVIIHSQGSGVLSLYEEAPTLDLTLLKERCNQNIISASQCYEIFKAMGFDYGPGHQGIEKLYMGSGQVLAELSLPSSVFDTKDQFVLHPSLMDAALQTSLMMGSDLRDGNIPRKPALPFALHELEIFGNCTPRMWALIRFGAGSKVTDTAPKLDIDICDEKGTICVRIKGFTLRVLEGKVGGRDYASDFGTLLVEPVWKEQSVTGGVTALDFGQYLTIFCEPDVTIPQNINTQMKGIGREYRHLTLKSNLKNIAERFQTYAVQVFEEVQRILNEKPQNNVLIQMVVSTQPEQELFAGLFGLLKTAQLENPKLIGQLIEIESGENAARLVEILKENARAYNDNRIRYQGGKRWMADWSEVTGKEEEELLVPWKDRGVYLITGGAGGLGLIFAKEIAERAKDVTLILTGRSKLSEAKQIKIEELRTLGARVDYRQVDVTQNKEVIELVKGIMENYGVLHGIIHSAGIIRDNYIIKKTSEELQEVLLPKVTGLVCLDLASQDLVLDFFILFSSFVGNIGNPGQADYSAANAFMDAYAKYRNILVTQGERHGHTLSINWPLWKEGGMRVDEAVEKMMLQNTGMASMQTNTGIRALYQGLVSAYEQVMVLEGKISRMKQKIFLATVPHPSTQFQKVTDVTMANTGSLFDKLRPAIIQIVSKLLKVKTEDIDFDTELNEYGCDSILLTQFANELNEEFKLELTPAIFFEYPTLSGFVKYLLDEYQTLFATRFAVQISKPSTLSGSTTIYGTSDLQSSVQVALIQAVSKLLKVKSEDIDPYNELREYGFDSILLTQFANKLNEEYKLELTPAIFFEYPTLNGFAGYLAGEHQEVFASRYALETWVPAEDYTGQTKNDFEESPIQSRRVRFAKKIALPESKQVSDISEPIAIIGMSGIFPGAGDVNEFWNNLLEGKDCITEIPKERWDWREYYGDPTKEPNKTNIKWGGFIDSVAEFDPLFFGLSPKEAELMDPGQRLLMMYVWKAIEDAGITAQSLSGTKTGIFIGTTSSGYSGLLSRSNIAIEGYSSTGMIPSVGPNRMSYFLNIHGPSEPIETACSSSLVAINRAVNAMENGACEMAIVGGVNTMVTPEFHISFNKAGMLCEDGRCKTFSDKANGYARGEGAGMIFLKKLSIAEQDGDHIYGLIRGTAENHGGRANSLTAPNPKAQAELLVTAYTKAGVDPRTITYIEAHGTGTKLGDPIEINGLKTAFKELYQVTGDLRVVNTHCGLGSVKTNIGHLEFAAGIAGVIKVLLQLKHKTLVKSLHCDTINPYIDLKDSPFYIVRESGEWKALQDANGQDFPRRAGVSSFGFGGANAHIVIEEYVPKAQELPHIAITSRNPAIVVLSAKNEDRLKEQAQQLLKMIREREFADSSLADLAYTLQVGREAMEERLALIVGSLKELADKLKSFIDGQESLSDLYRGQIKRNQDTLAIFTADEDLGKAIDTWISKGKYPKLLDLWVKGLSFDWHKLYGDFKPRRMSLPTYPFAKERYWVPAETHGRASQREYIHPLLHQNTSTLAEQRFSSTFTGREFFLADHVVKGQRVLPGVAYLEMAQAAVKQAAEVLEESQIGIRLKNIVWAQPIVVGDQPVQVNIVLLPKEKGDISYEIYSKREENGAEDIIHSQGYAVLSSFDKLPALDLAALKAFCNLRIISSNQCYEVFKAMGFEYGPGHRGIEKIYIGPTQVLAQLSLPASVFDSKDQFVLHPSMMDAALQASLMVNLDNRNNSGTTQKPALPFALNELEIFDNCAPHMWALIRYSQIGDAARKLDIDICDDQGTICVRMRGFTLRILEGKVGADTRELSSSPAIGTMMFEPVWKEQAVFEGVPVPDYGQNLTILCEPGEINSKSIDTKMKGSARVHRCLALVSTQETMEQRFQAYAVQIFEEIQRILQGKPQDYVLIQLVVSTLPEQQPFTGLFGLLKTAGLENPKLITQLIEIEPGERAAGLIAKLTENARQGVSLGSINNRIRYQDGKRWVADWDEVAGLKEDELKIPWQDRGIYLITGGAGGLGLILANEIARRAKDVTLILTGRATLTEEKQAKLDELRSLGAQVDYRQVDVTQKKAVTELIQGIRENYGSLYGIIHSAGIIRDNYIIKKTKEEFQEVLLPKVTGLVNLDLASQEMPLDFFLLFSSIAGSLGNQGQADYSTANAFMDAYANYRNELVASGQRQGRALSINWPLWKEGGMRVDETVEKMMKQNTGMIAMRTGTGIQALYQSLASGKSRVMVMEGKIARMKQKMLAKTSGILENKETAASDAATGLDLGSLLDKTQSTLIKTASNLLKVKLEDIDIHTELSEYGFDSISLTQFANKLNEEYKLELTPAIFFEHPTINSFAKYLTDKYQAVFASKFAVQTRVETPTEYARQDVEDDAEEVSYKGRRRSRFATLSESNQISNIPEPIAIIGMSGIFPGAGDVDEFWRNLLESKDCITEIPKDRWDWREYYGDPAMAPNKTNIKWGGFIDGVYEFDPFFFGISPKEAELMDPGQRLLMMYVWKAIEDAGYSAQSLSGSKTGIFIGVANTGYSGLVSRLNIDIEGYSATGIVSSVGPNRMSYFLNIHGPSEPVETACSSSLVAIHRAVNAMYIGNCEMAITGGVNTMLTPDFHISFSKAGMLSEDGRCKTFSDQANGYARGEGAGMIFLKRLSAAERDGDHIYGVIRGTAENHGGRANSLTAPNPKAQAELLVTAYTKAGIDPRTVTYIEAHGTGTKLGDPVEINGLKTAFKELYQTTGDPRVENSHCGLGSVKTNIGHLELAAGIAGVIKVLLQLKYKTLVKSLHCNTINPYIELKDSPFYIVQEINEWKALQDAAGQNLPRRAGVSSFGFGGANAHVVIEEYIPKFAAQPQITVTDRNPAIIVLSAKNEEQLKKQVKQLINAIAGQQFPESSLADIAYTLQVGREPMEERLALIVNSGKELEEKLKGFAAGQDGIADLYRGQVKPNKEALTVLAVDEDMEKTVEAWINKGKYAKLLDLWVKGLIFDWHKLYGVNKPHRISLPTYPFATECYGVPVETHNHASLQEPIHSPVNSYIHPLVHQNTSTLAEQCFSATFTGREFFLADHVVKEQRVLPGVAYLEMARAAVFQSTGVLEEDQTRIRLKNVVWTRPIVVGEQPIKVNIGIFAGDNEEITYEIYSGPESASPINTQTEPIVYSQGSVIFSAGEKIPPLDLKGLLAECNQNVLSAAECYAIFEKMGFKYGSGHQGIEKIYVGKALVLAKLTLPASVLATKDQFVLHPSMMDGALQASVGLMVNTGELNISLPFALQELQIISKCTSTMWAWIRNSNENASNGRVRKLDIDLCDEYGNVCVRMKGYTSGVLDGELGHFETRASVGTGAPEKLLLAPVWKEETVPEEIPTPDYALHLLILCEPENISRESLETQMNGVARDYHCLVLQSNGENIDARFQKYAAQVFEEIQSILNERPKENILIQIVITNQFEKQLFAGLFGLLKTAGLENPKLITQLIEIEPVERAAGLIEKLKENARQGVSLGSIDNRIRYQDGKRWVAAWDEVVGARAGLKEDELKIPWQDRGIYLITGGAGGLGLIFAKEIARRAKDVTLILTGRSTLTEEKQAKLDELRSLGARVDYRQVDVTQKKAVTELIQGIRESYGSLQGIIHSAGIIRDNYIIKKTKEEFHEVLLPKVTGLVNLDLASQEMPLDFFILFSSIAGSLGNQGQADYSTANAFLDAYANYRNELVASGQRQGRALSINWPLWKEGGMRVDETVEKMMRQNTGMIAMRTETGIQALYQSLASGKSWVMVMEGKIARMKQKMFAKTSGIPENKETAAASDTATGLDLSNLLDKTQSTLIKTASNLLKVKLEDIDNHTELSEYGFDSISLTQFANKLNEEYKLELTPAIFFEHPTINSFAKYLTEEYQAVFASKFAVQTRAEILIEHAGQAVEDDAEEVSYKGRRRPRFASQGTLLQSNRISNVPEPIAIIGMSGIFPGAGDVDEFWRNLLEGKDCITEIPKDRWDWRQYYGDPAKDANKTNIKWGGFIDGVYEFDPFFFGISPKEAELMDPGQRLLMMYVWKAIEDAGYSAQSLSGSKTGIFVGSSNTGFSGLVSRLNIDIEGYSATGIVSSVGPNRMSYFLNIHGPSEPVETACSSSLVAIHRAVCAMENGNCDMAIAGGVNTMLTPDFHISFSKAGMLSEDGRCKTFSDLANGYARGEGAGMIFLKKLSAAERDGDHIYGVIRGTAENHGGRANSLTAPNPKAQAELLVTAFTKAGIDPRTVTYIEAHGTGTKLGDPVEINGLKTAFKELYQTTGEPLVVNSHCGLGSVKTNIGHLELAAGIAGIIKVLLQLKHKTLVKSLHCDTLNPYIELKDSPFYIVREIKEWKALQDAAGQDLPRRAGVSSFGFGGVNAHVVIEEYIPKFAAQPQITVTDRNPAIIVLSAKNEEQLKSKVKQLINAIAGQQLPESSLADIAYTLQVGREPMEERLALIVSSVKELEEKLNGFAAGQDGIADLYRGQVKPNKEALTVLAVDEDMEKTVDAWINKGKWAKIMELWVKGFSFDWNKLYGKFKPCRIALPTYPFAKECYGVPGGHGISGFSVETHGRASLRKHRETIHPLLHQNTSTLAEQCFSTTFTGREFFLADHVVKEQRVLPGVVYLEMVRAAVDASCPMATGVLEEDQTEIRLKNVVWARPIVVREQPIEINIRLLPGDNEEITFEIYSNPQNDFKTDMQAEPIVYSQGSVNFSAVKKIPPLDLKALQEECSQSRFSAAECYALFEIMGFKYGPGHQGIEGIFVGNGLVLAKLSLPASVSETKDQFVLHPSLMDAALQASVGFLIDTEDYRLSLPFALQELQIVGKCTSSMWALIRNSQGGASNAKTRKLDIDLCDEQGDICARMKGYTSGVLEGVLDFFETKVSKESGALGTLMLEPVWREDAVPGETPLPDYAQYMLILCELEDISRESLETGMNGVARDYRCLVLQSNGENVAERFQKYAVQLLAEVKNILNEKPKEHVLIQMIVVNQPEKQLFGGLFGLLNTAQLENPKLITQLIAVEPDEGLAGISEKLKENSKTPMPNRIQYQNGKRYVASWSELNVSKDEAGIPWRDRGVYLITGGTGGLGLIFAKEIARRAKDVTLILIGRATLSEEKQAKLEEIRSLGARVDYRQADVTQKKAVTELIQDIRENYGSLHGIIHSAGIIRDNYIIKKAKEEFNEVLPPKVAGLVNLDLASQNLPLDFFVLFSSIAASLGNPGQADYSTANAFMDAYANYRNELVTQGQRQGQTLSINWPLWKEGGMRVEETVEKMMGQNTGMIAMRTDTGIQAFYQSITSGKSRVMVMEGKIARLKQKLLSKVTSEVGELKKTAATSEFATGGDVSSLLDKVQSALIKAVSDLLKVKLEDIDIHTELSEYGFDSISLTQFANKLNEEYKLELTPALFFEHPTISSFAKYLIEEYQGVFASKFAVKSGVNNRAEDYTSQAEENNLEESQNFQRNRPRFVRTRELIPLRQEPNTEAIAIIGMSGIFPGAPDLDEFWSNLLEGKDCITEIPIERWDWRHYYGDPAKNLNKTNIKWGGFIDGIDEFDPLFFGISPKEAELMDPQQRLLMMYVWKAIEDAGYSAQSLSGTQTGIFVGTAPTGYSGLVSRLNIAIEGYSATGMVSSVGPNRMSYFLNIHGPSEPVETACSSSLVALHRAVCAMRMGNCEMAVVGGVNTIVTPDFHISFNKAGMLSEDGRCKTFSDQANGYVRGEGAGMLFLKKLTAAERDEDHIYGVIRGTAENHGGRANSLTAPNPKAQADLLVTAYTKAGIDPRTVTYIEAHGTGTKLGDPIEINGLKTAFKELYQATGDPQVVDSHCGLGSVKTNIGHLELAAGIAGVIKVLLQLKHKTLVKSLHCDTINPYIELKDSPFYIVREAKEWKVLQDATGQDIPRRAGVSSFGFGGANAHVVIEEYIPKFAAQPQITATSRNPAIIVLSAKNEDRLKSKVQQLLDVITGRQFPETSLTDIAYTLQVGREPMEERLALIVGSLKELEDKLKGLAAGQDGITDLYRGQVKRNQDALASSALAVFTADEDLGKAIDAWINKGKYPKLLDLWVKGLIFDWNKLYGDTKPHRISLPTYPFIRERFWVPESMEKVASSLQGNTQFDDAFYDHLLDELLNKTISIDTAVQITKDSSKRKKELLIPGGR